MFRPRDWRTNWLWVTIKLEDKKRKVLQVGSDSNPVYFQNVIKIFLQLHTVGHIHPVNRRKTKRLRAPLHHSPESSWSFFSALQLCCLNYSCSRKRKHICGDEPLFHISYWTQWGNCLLQRQRVITRLGLRLKPILMSQNQSLGNGCSGDRVCHHS